MLPTATRPEHIVQSLFGDVDWIDALTGFIKCPGADLHSHRSTKRDCRIKLDGAPTLYCVHNSCAGVIAEKNHLLRSEIGKFERGQNPNREPWRPTPADDQ